MEIVDKCLNDSDSFESFYLGHKKQLHGFGVLLSNFSYLYLEIQKSKLYD
jgi:hypothetical protein